MDGPGESSTTVEEKKAISTSLPIRVLLLDDRIDDLVLRAAILRKHGYQAITASTIEEAEAHLQETDNRNGVVLSARILERKDPPLRMPEPPGA
jgi:response regulator RpfG family c-di-GMP phosphodiesterase